MSSLNGRDPYILLSVINTKLRDNYSSLEDLCKAENISIEELTKKLSEIKYVYNLSNNQFIAK